VEIDRSLARGKTEFEATKSAEGAAWLKRIEDDNAGDLTPERLAALEAAAARQEADGNGATPLPQVKKIELDEAASPTEGRRFTRA
jgi:(E)-4-hydroxy-3-methylbut-2-enyl-diphosphate synthase